MNPAAPVLLAEDDDNDVFLVRRAFARSGIARPLAIVATGQDAIDYLAGAGPYAAREPQAFPSLLLLDLKLPLRSGFEVLEWVRGDGAARVGAECRALPVVVLTSSSQERDIYRAYELGANAYLVKTGRPAELASMIRGVGRFWLGSRAERSSVNAPRMAGIRGSVEQHAARTEP